MDSKCTLREDQIAQEKEIVSGNSAVFDRCYLEAVKIEVLRLHIVWLYLIFWQTVW